MNSKMARRVVAVIGVCAAATAPLVGVAGEVRALWVVRTTLTSPAAIAAMIDTAKASGFNTLLVQVRGRGDAYYMGGREPRAQLLASQPDFDPLATTMVRAHQAGLAVHAWINVNFISAADELPAARNHVVYRHPEWLMVPRALGADLVAVDPHDPEYVGRLARYVRALPAQLEGLYVSPITNDAIEYTTGVVRDLVRRYPVDGVHFDYMRYPDSEFDYSRAALAAFRASVIRDLAPADVRRYDRRLRAEPLIYTDAFPERWRNFRMDRLTTLVVRLREAVRGVRPSAVVSAAVFPDPVEAATERLQDWKGWLARNLIDVICPMAYTVNSATFATQITTVSGAAGSHPVWAGIGAYRLTPDQTVDNIQTARRLGAGGIILFSYDSLTAPAHDAGYLNQLGRAAFAPSQ